MYNYCQPPYGYTRQTPASCVTSYPTPQPGQKNRSSSNFTVPATTNYTVSGLPNNASVQVWHNVGFGKDGMVGTVSDGETIKLLTGNNDYYLGNPQGFGGQNISVCFTPS